MFPASTILFSLSLLISAISVDDRLSVGDPAPALSIEHFVKGERVDTFPTDKVTVVEFWATWCKPCIEGFPHLSELQERYPDDVVIIGVSAEDLDTVQPFLDKARHADVTRYRMTSDPDGSMQTDWMTAARQNSIPCAFIIDREGIVQYIGHPMGMDRVLERVVTGKAPAASEGSSRPKMSDEERAALTTVEKPHSPAAAAVLETLRADLSAPAGTLAFEQELVLHGALRMGGPDSRPLDLRKTRVGELELGDKQNARLDAERTMHLPGMPGAGMIETESVIYDGDRIWLKFRSDSGFMNSPLPSDDWTTITRGEAQSLLDEVPMPLAMTALMEVNPIMASPLDLLDALLAMSALEVVPTVGGASELVVLEGIAAPMAGVPPMLLPQDPDGVSGPVRPTLHLEFDRTAGVVTICVGDPMKPTLTMRIARRETALSHFEIDSGDGSHEEPRALLPILQQRMDMMRGMAPSSSR